MKKHLYTIFVTLALLFSAAMSQAQVTVTYIVDMSDSVASPTFSYAAAGMRIGGNFVDFTATLTDGTPLPQWSPSSPPSAMTNIGGNLWGITVVYPNSAIGDTQQWKFVNGDWGGDETQLPAECGFGGLGSANHFLVIPSANAVYQSKFNQCGTLTLTGIPHIQGSVGAFDVYPSPAIDFTQITYGLNVKNKVTVTLRSFTGRELRTLVDKEQSPGVYTYDLRTDDLANGMYFVQIKVNGNTYDRRFVVNR